MERRFFIPLMKVEKYALPYKNAEHDNMFQGILSKNVLLHSVINELITYIGNQAGRLMVYSRILAKCDVIALLSKCPSIGNASLRKFSMQW